MIAPLKQTLRFESAQRPRLLPATGQVADGSGAAGLAFASGAAGFFCLLPYPALSIGGTSALQIGNFLTVLMVLPVMAMSWRGRAFWIYPLILLPLCLSAAKIGVMGDGDVAASLKAMAVWAISCLTIFIPQLYARRYALNMLVGVALAMLLHAGLGLWQLYSFSSGVFPFAEWYVNQSFLSVQENADTIARYTQRPFGLFPEPSAMSSSLAPWVLFYAAHFCGVIRMRQRPARWQEILFAVAAVSGLGLIILSQSGHAAVTLAAMLLFAMVWFLRCGATLRTYLSIVGMLGVVLPAVLWFAAMSLGNRVGDSQMGNSSWAERSASLRLGFGMLIDGDNARAVFGIGVGHVAPALWNVAQIDAVFSVLLTYVYETGLIGLMAVCAIGLYLARVWRSLGFNLAYAAIAGVWLVGITLTTSYEQLLSLWMVLGWLIVWPEVCEGPVVVRKRPLARTPVEEVIGEPGVSVASSAIATAAGTARPKRWTDQ
ncbi:MAG: putative rane protein [Phycisphaerales bacterium]|nr:putative rane protein [Phycisphaerales bacterium]